MDSITSTKRYLPHEVHTTFYAVRLYRQEHDVSFVLRRVHLSKASLMRQNKLLGGTKESLVPKSHRPHSPHPNAHTKKERKGIRDFHCCSSGISIRERYGKLREEKAYTRHPGSLYRVFVRLGYRNRPESTQKKSKHNGRYDTPLTFGEKWQMDVKYVPECCYCGPYVNSFFRYTILAEASGKR